MKTNILTLTALALIWSASSLAQSCGLEATATLNTELWGSEISFTVSDDNGVSRGFWFGGFQHNHLSPLP